MIYEELQNLVRFFCHLYRSLIWRFECDYCMHVIHCCKYKHDMDLHHEHSWWTFGQWQFHMQLEETHDELANTSHIVYFVLEKKRLELILHTLSSRYNHQKMSISLCILDAPN